jgi:hypothetical protein
MELSHDQYAVIGGLIVTNLGLISKLVLNWVKSKKEEAEVEKKKAVETALIQAQMTTLTMTIGELKEGFSELRRDFNGSYGMWRQKNDG